MALPLLGRVLSGKFRFVRKLGKGGMASVWLAINTAVDREVAIKVIRPEVLKNEDLVARFRSEAKAAGRIAHPHVCEILDFGVGPIGPYIVMERLKGKNLAQLIRERGSLSPEETVDLVQQALLGLQAAHAEGIVHRDLKPENVYLHEPKVGPPIVKLMDFGVAKFTDGSSEITTEHGALLGTPEYMAPEQFKGADQAEIRTDLWAVGAIIFRALTGKHAFKGATVAATLLLVSHEDPVPIQTLKPGVPQALVDVVNRCLSKDIDDRYGSVAQLQEALSQALELDPDADDPDDEGPTAPSLPRVSPAIPLPTDETSDVPAEEPPVAQSAIERRPTEPFAASTSPSRRLWLVGGLAAVALAVAVALWPSDTPPAAEPVPAAPQSPEATPRAAPPAASPTVEAAAVVPKLDVGNPEADVVILEDVPTPDVGTRTAPPATDVPPPPAEGAFEAPPPVPKPSPPPEPEALPPGVVDLGNGYVFSVRRGKRSDHGNARSFCDALGRTGHLGFSGWKLVFPGVVKRISQSGRGPRGTYWTSARWRGNVTTFALPSGEMKKGVSADRRAARALCVAEISSRS
ncbi:MAG: serine/threonine-protein kinase [Nannocystales bacterium]